MVGHVPSHAQLEKEQMAEPMNTPVDLASQTPGNDHCNEIENNEKCISIINSHLYIYIVLFFCR